MQDFTLIIKTKDKIGTFMLCVLVSVGLTVYLRNQHKPTWSDPILYLLIIAALCYGLWLICGQIKLILRNDKMFIDYRFSILPFFRKTYFVNSISSIEVRKNEKGDSYWSLLNFDFGLFDYTPEKARVYDINPTVIYFRHGTTLNKIGEGLEKFDVNNLVKEIRQRQSTK